MSFVGSYSSRESVMPYSQTIFVNLFHLWISTKQMPGIPFTLNFPLYLSFSHSLDKKEKQKEGSKKGDSESTKSGQNKEHGEDEGKQQILEKAAEKSLFDLLDATVAITIATTNDNKIIRGAIERMRGAAYLLRAAGIIGGWSFPSVILYCCLSLCTLFV